MKIVGIVAIDYANAAWNVFRALQRYGLDAKLINLKKRYGPTESFYDVQYRKHPSICQQLIAEADIYHIFPSGRTIPWLRKLKLKDRPRIISLNAGRWHNKGPNPQRILDTQVRPIADMITALTPNLKLEGVRTGLQPLPSDEYPIRRDYSLLGPELVVGAAPGYTMSAKKKKHIWLKQKIKHYDMVMGLSQKQLKIRMQGKHDVFTHGIGPAGGYGYSMTQAAMFGIPCFAHLIEGNVDSTTVSGIFPILRLGSNAEHLNEILELFSEEENRRKYGQLCARWARKYHSYKACYKTYKSYYEELLGNNEK